MPQTVGESRKRWSFAKYTAIILAGVFLIQFQLFFYVYAGGQYLFCNALKICPEEHNAQLLTGMLLQVGFWSLAMGVLATHVRQRTTALTIAGIGFIHFYYANQAFISIWPPHQLLMPFLCMLLSGASIVCDSRRWTWLFALSAGFCVNGHVAQPLFVIPLSVLVVVASFRTKLPSSRDGRLEFSQRVLQAWLRPGIAVSAITLVPFLVPMVVDVMSGRESNFARICEHALSHAGSDHSWREALCYNLQFYRYWGFHDLPSTSSILGLFWLSPWVFTGWIVAALATCYVVFSRANSHDVASEDRRWFKGLLLVSLIVHAMSLYWGRMMDGAMFAFNSLFSYATIFVDICILVFVASRFLRTKTQLIGLAVVGVLVVEVVLKPVPDSRWISDNGFRPLQAVLGVPLTAANDQATVYLRSKVPASNWDCLVGQLNFWRTRGVNVVTGDDFDWLVGADWIFDPVDPDSNHQKLICVDLIDVKRIHTPVSILEGRFQSEVEDTFRPANVRMNLDRLKQDQIGFSEKRTADDHSEYVTLRKSHGVLAFPAKDLAQDIDVLLRLDVGPVSPSNKTCKLSVMVDQVKCFEAHVSDRKVIEVLLDSSVIANCISTHDALIVVFSISETQSSATLVWNKEFLRIYDIFLDSEPKSSR